MRSYGQTCRIAQTDGARLRHSLKPSGDRGRSGRETCSRRDSSRLRLAPPRHREPCVPDATRSSARRRNSGGWGFSTAWLLRRSPSSISPSTNESREPGAHHRVRRTGSGSTSCRTALAGTCTTAPSYPAKNAYACIASTRTAGSSKAIHPSITRSRCIWPRGAVNARCEPPRHMQESRDTPCTRHVALRSHDIERTHSCRHGLVTENQSGVYRGATASRNRFAHRNKAPRVLRDQRPGPRPTARPHHATVRAQCVVRIQPAPYEQQVLHQTPRLFQRPTM